MINDVVRNALEISNTALEYIRGGVVSYVFYEGGQTIELFAMPTQQRTFALEVDGYVHDAVLMDWIVRADELGGLQPTQHDRIMTGTDVWRVQHPAGAREWEFHDPYQDSYRIHTILDPSTSVPPSGGGKPYENYVGLAYENSDNKEYLNGS